MPRDSENSIREHRYTFVFMLESAALMTTKFMMPAAYAMPDCANTLTKGLCSTTFAPVSVQGTNVDDDRESQNVEEEQPQQHGAQRRRDRLDRIAASRPTSRR